MENRLTHNNRILASSLAALSLLYYLANLYRMFTSQNEIYFIVFFAAGGIGWLIYLLSNAKESTLYIPAVFMSFAFINLVLVGNANISSIINEFVLFGITYLLILYNPSNKQASLFFWITCFAFIFAWFSGESASLILISSSNYVSVLLILAACIYYTSRERNGKEPTLLPIAMCFLLSLWASGRSGILVTATVFILVLFQIVVKGKQSRRKKIVFGIIVISIVIFGVSESIWHLALSKFNIFLRDFDKSGLDNGARLNIWADYLKETFQSISNIFLGTPVNIVPELMRYGGNTHNGPLYLHLTHGLITLGLYMVLFIRSIKYYWNEKMPIHLIFGLAFFARAFFDKFAFMQYGMPIAMYFVMYPLFRGKKVSDSLSKKVPLLPAVSDSAKPLPELDPMVYFEGKINGRKQ